jgi:hypothetical protein
MATVNPRLWGALAFSASCLLLVNDRVHADFITLPVKWSQPIGIVPGTTTIEGVDHLSNHLLAVVRADDFISDGRPVTAVRWWGSYIGDTTPRHTDFVGPFDISFHTSILGAAAPHPFSLPSLEPIYFTTVEAQQEFVGFDTAGDAVYRYDAFLPTPFHEVAGHEYFLDIDKPVNQEHWGWHDAKGPHPILDWSAVAPTHGGPWSTATDPLTDLAFELMTPVPEAQTWLTLMAGLCAIALMAGWRTSRTV